MVRMGKLHDLFRKKKKKDIYVGIIKIALCFVPLLGEAIGFIKEGVQEVVTSLTSEVAGQAIVVDMSSWQNILMLTNNTFLSSLEDPVKKRINKVMEHSKFGTFKTLKEEILQASKWIGGDELLGPHKDHILDIELRRRFETISHPSKDQTYSFKKATKELQHILNDKIPVENISKLEIENKLRGYMNEVGRIDLSSFLEVFAHFYKAGNKKKSLPAEIKDRFQSAADGESTICKVVAVHVLKTLYDHSGPASGRTLSFTRTTNSWDENQAGNGLPSEVSE